VPLAHPPGHAQVDFGECIGIIGGVRTKLHVFCKSLDLRFQSLPLEIAARHSSHGGEFGERIDPVKDAAHRLRRREQGSRP
jgi:hypothetical protein